MGLFLQTAIFPGSDRSVAEAAVRQAAEEAGDCGRKLERCRYEESGEGTQVLLGDESAQMIFSAEALSKAGRCPVLLLYIYDGDYWGYDFFDNGERVDSFNPCPDYFGTPTESQRRRLEGKPEDLTDFFPAASKEIRSYLRFWTEDLLEEERFARPGDRFPYGDCWQMTDFTACLGYPWPFDGERETVPPQPALREILDKRLPPRPMDNPDLPAWNAKTFYHTANLPSALDPGYIRRLLREAEPEFQVLQGKTPDEIIGAYMAAEAAIQHPTLYHVNSKLANLSAFCHCWLGNADGAFWCLYQALYNDPDNLFLRRARGLQVALFSKRHIAIQDLTALMKLDPDNRDVYLLCRAFFYHLDAAKQRPCLDDLEELGGIGVPSRRDARVNYDGFTPGFLELVNERRRRG